MAKKSKYQIWQKKRQRIKYRIMQKNITVLSASSIDTSLKPLIDKASSKIEKSKIVGESLSEKIKNAKIERIIFDRNGYKYHGRVKALTEAIRSTDIKI